MDETLAAIARLEGFLQLGAMGHICREDGCYNACERGTTMCIACIHGVAERADQKYVVAKKELMRLYKRRERLYGTDSPTPTR